MLLVTAQELHSQGDALVPLPRQNADISGVKRRLKDVLFVDVVVAVAWEDLDREQQPIKTRHIRAAACFLNNSWKILVSSLQWWTAHLLFKYYFP